MAWSLSVLLFSAALFCFVALQASHAFQHQEEQRRVFGGTIAEEGAYPWLGALYYKSSADYRVSDFHLCGGSLVSSRHVLTAAHCIYDNEGKVEKADRLAVLFNVLSTNITQGEARGLTGQNFDVLRIIPYPEYDTDFYTGDYAILELDGEVEGITPIQLDNTENSDDWAGETLKFAGWGLSDYGGVIHYSKVLLENDLQGQPFEDCMDALYGDASDGYAEVYREWIICGVDNPVWAGLGSGDSGGPLFFNSDPPLLIGVSSWGVDVYHDDGSELAGSYPNAWAYVATVREWILEQTGQEDDGSSTDGSSGDGGDGSAASHLNALSFL
ncbi:venom protease-like [Balamuthia mandrillaris]